MCTLCASLAPARPNAEWTQHLAEGNRPLAQALLANRTLLAAATPEQIADQLVYGYWEWSGQDWRALDARVGDTITVDISGLPADTAFLAEMALQAWTDVSGLVFDIVTPSVLVKPQIVIDDNLSGAFTTATTLGNTLLSARVNVDDRWDRDPVSINSYWFQTYVHEIGHALGLGHAGDYNGDAAYPPDAKFENDSWLISVMSYFSQTDNTAVDASYAFVVTPMQADILAVQMLYGSNVVTRPGDTTYGANGTTGGYLDLLFAEFYDADADADDPLVYIDNPFALTIHDTGGIDTLDLSPAILPQRVDLTPETGSDIAGLRGNLWISRGTVIENAIGGAGNDTIAGNSAANSLTGNAGSDSLTGAEGDDTLNGGAGADAMDGGAGIDTVSYQGSTGSLRIDLQYPDQNTFQADGDSYAGIENLIGSQGADNIRGDTAANRIGGAANVDYLFGRQGNDTLAGDVGDDVLQGGAGADLLDGGDNRDRAQYSESLNPLLIDLASPALNTFEAAGDSFVSIEDLAGGLAADDLRGTDAANRLFGREDNDKLYGRGGDDYLNGSGGRDYLVGGPGNDTLRGGASADVFNFTAGQDVIEDFQTGDQLQLDDALWGGAVLTPTQILDLAQVVAGSTVLTFAGNQTLTLLAWTDPDALAGALVIA